MEAEELRIGNLVTDNWGSTIYEVYSINSKGINLFVEDDGNWSELAKTWVGAEYEFEAIKGIELTGEWLVKFGFEKLTDRREGFNNTSYSKRSIYLTDNVNGTWSPTFSDTRIKYLHQLQNLFYALTGEELVWSVQQ